MQHGQPHIAHLTGAGLIHHHQRPDAVRTIRKLPGGAVVAVRHAGGTNAGVGMDGRLSSPALADAVAEGLRDCGLTVWRTGLGPSPMLYFAVHTLGADGGVMITGSHNPADYNGFKMMLGKSGFYGEAIQEPGMLSARVDTTASGARAWVRNS